MYFDKCIITCNHHYTIIQNIFIALKILCLPPIYPSPNPQPLGTTELLASIVLALSRMSCVCNHTVQSLFRLASFT